MRAFKVDRSVSLDRLLLGVIFFFAVAAGAHAGGNHFGNSKLTISGTPATTDVTGQPYSFTPSASGPGHSTLTFAISGKPAWASFDSTTGTLAGTPTSANIGVFGNIVISVIDGGSTSSLAPFAITVSAPPNSPPTISGTPSTSTVVGSTYSFTPTAADTDGDPLSFAIQNQPAWAGFDSATGTLSGTPTSADVGVFGNITISVSDGVSTSSLAPFAITVAAPPNSPPTISGTPPTSTMVGSTYSFTPTAGDSDGDSLTFAIQNRPAWASFSTASGSLTGAPASADAGTYSNIVISVSDGLTSASLPAFSITVAQAASGSGNADVSWTPPTTATDGSVLTDLAGYNIYYGTSATALTQKVQITNIGVTDYIFSGLTSGTWYFAVTAYTSTGAESAPSNVVSKTIS